MAAVAAEWPVLCADGKRVFILPAKFIRFQYRYLIRLLIFFRYPVNFLWPGNASLYDTEIIFPIVLS